MLRHANEHGFGQVVPDSEAKERPTVSMTPDLEDHYRRQRDILMAALLPDIEENANVSATRMEFTTIPDSELKLDVDPDAHSRLYIRQYNIPHSLLPFAQIIIKRWLDNGVIREAPTLCPFNVPLLLVPKKDEHGNIVGIRVCLDFRALNKALRVDDRFPIPLIRDILASLANHSIFGQIDLSEAYNQFRLHPDSQIYTAFTFEGKQYVFVGIPFGLNLLPSWFQRLISRTFNLSFLVPYFDNIAVKSKTWSEHFDHCRALLRLCTHYRLRIKPSSIKFGYAQFGLVGHLVGVDGISLHPSKMKVIDDWPRPITGKDLQRFLGLGTYLRDITRDIERTRVIWIAENGC